MHHEVVNPDQKDQCIDWQNPQHEHEYRMGIVGEVKMRSEPLSLSVEAQVKKSETGRKKKKKKTYSFSSIPLGPHTGYKVNHTNNHISELVWDNRQYENQKNSSVDDASPGSWCTENRHIPEKGQQLFLSTHFKWQTHPLSSRRIYPNLLCARPYAKDSREIIKRAR